MINKKLKLVLLGFTVLVVIIVAGLYLFGAHLIRDRVAKAASNSAGREVTIRDMSYNLWRGDVGFDNITVENAEGYDFPLAMKIEKGFIDTRIISLLGQKVKVNSIKLTGVEIFVEQQAMNNNLRDLLAAMPALEEPEGPEQREGKTVNVETTTIEDITVNVKIVGRNGEEPRSLKIKIDPITLENLGTEEEINSGAIAARIIIALATGAIKQSAEELPGEVVNQIISLSEKIIDFDNLNLGKGREIIEETGEQLFEGVLDLITD